MSDKPQSRIRHEKSRFDAYDPDEVAERVLQVGVKKTRAAFHKTLILGTLGGCFISLGALWEVYVRAHPAVDPGTAFILGPIFYAMGYILAFIAGAEIFTTNNLAAMSWASGKVTLFEITRNWTLVLFANLTGAAFIAGLFWMSGLVNQFDDALIDTAKTISAMKVSFTPLQTIVIGIFGNMLICAGLWLAMAGRSVTDQFFSLLLPVAAVPAMNFQHCTGNMFQFFLALTTETATVDLDLPSQITFWSVSANLLYVAVGNIIGGGVFIALVYYFVFIRK
ncbi:MAG: formate/nitrite transporter family protein [Candidatus Cyclonatronum sp.]|uniref:formate/nitrite transporter family protein n=1 Tax=Cyclonatronum sp. TaxID=3024185 RepID=UPI0025BEAEBB|nr:formate/nitrite transporter family protein [Cyclonatronum sp.]MCH8487946.1 formate/nitrite transporter family protein [Cyclonatronum sp.]